MGRQEYAPKEGTIKEKKNFNETKISNLPDKGFKETVIRMLNNLESRIEELRENFKEMLENVVKDQLGRIQ